VPTLADPEWTFALGAARRAWPAVQRRLGERAWPMALTLAGAGMLAVRCTVGEDLRLGPPTGWHLLDLGARLAVRRAATVAAQRAGDEEHREDLLTLLSSAITTGDPPLPLSGAAAASLLRALREESGAARGPVLRAAAADLLEGVTHDGPRAFSLAHFADSKVRDNAAAVLADAGVNEEVAAVLGLRRAPRIGVGGAVDVELAGLPVPLSRLDGPILLRADQPGLRLVTTATHMIVVENLQAAEALADHRSPNDGALAVLYTAGTPSAASLGLIARLAAQFRHILLCPDADLGGVRIATAVLRALPAAVAERVDLLDPGEWPHKPQRPWPADGATVHGLQQHLHGPAAQLARACLDRGYRVEQEDTIRAAAGHWLASRVAADPD
jgi:hypothetical protein